MASYCNYTGPFFPGLSVNLNREGPGILQSELLKRRQRVDNRSDENWEKFSRLKQKKAPKRQYLLVFYCNTVKPLLSGHPRGMLWCPLNTGCPPNTGFDR